MITEKDLYGLRHYLYGEAFYGSSEGMRFRVARVPLENVVFKKQEEQDAQNPKLKAEVWFTPFAYEKTPEEEITGKEFAFTDEGYREMVSWLNTVEASEGFR